MTCLGSHGELVAELRIELRSPGSDHKILLLLSLQIARLKIKPCFLSAQQKCDFSAEKPVLLTAWTAASPNTACFSAVLSFSVF